MARPPINPVKIKDDKNISYFKMLAVLANKYLKEDGITLDFTGYEETIIEYSELEENDIEKAWKLTKELNAWTEYFSDLANLLQKQYLDSETEKIEVQAQKSLEHNNTNVSAGDRYANTDTDVVKQRKKRNTLKSFYDELIGKIKFLERGYYHCKSTCEWANKLKTSYNSSNNEFKETEF